MTGNPPKRLRTDNLAEVIKHEAIVMLHLGLNLLKTQFVTDFFPFQDLEERHLGAGTLPVEEEQPHLPTARNRESGIYNIQFCTRPGIAFQKKKRN